MGLFSSKKKVTVNTTVQPLFKTSDLPNSFNSGLVEAYKDSRTLMPDVTQSFVQSIGMRGTASWLWAKDGYHYGTPRADMATDNQAQAQVLSVLQGLYGNDLTLNYYTMGPLNSVHFAWRYLFTSQGYNPVTNRLATLEAAKGTAVYLKDIVPEYTDETVTYLTEQDELWQLDVREPYANAGVTLSNPTGNPAALPTPYTINTTATSNTVKIYYEYLSGAVNTTESITITIPAADEDEDWHQARITQANGTVVYFSYKHGLGTYPTIDNALKYDFTEAGTYLPWVYYRFNFTNLAVPANFNTEAYKDSHHYCRYIGVGYQEMADSIYEDSDLEDVIQSMLIFGIRADASSLSEREYLFRYFDMLYQRKQLVGAGSQFSQLIQDKQFKMSFSFAGITKTTLTGNVAQVGKYAAPLISGSQVTYCKQTTATEYEAIVVTSPRMRYHILGKYGFSAGLGQSQLLIPLDRAVFKAMGLKRREDLLARGLHFMTNTYVETESKWYQSSWFKIVLIVAAVVCMIIPGMQGAGITLASLATATGLLLAAQFLLVYAIKAIITKFVIKMFIDVAGLENSLLAAVLMIVASRFVPTTMANSAAISEGLMSAGTNLVTSTTTGTGQELAALQEEMQAFSAYAEDKWKQLEDRRAEEFGLPNGVNTLRFSSLIPATNLTESPETFFERTIHSGNPGVHTLTLHHDFVDNKLTLPSISETFQGWEPKQQFHFGTV